MSIALTCAYVNRAYKMTILYNTFKYDMFCGLYLMDLYMEPGFFFYVFFIFFFFDGHLLFALALP